MGESAFHFKATAAILAGGKNVRFNGLIKPLVPLRGRTLLKHQMDVLQPLFAEILLITNQPGNFAGYQKYTICRDLIPDRGPLSGIHAALSHAKHEKVFVFAGDMPFLESAMIGEQVGVYEKQGVKAVIPRIGHYIEPLHALYPKNTLGKLERHLQTVPDGAVRRWLETIPVFYWDVDRHKPFININTPEELKKYEKD